jgi:transglutaminase superfamily protein
MAEPGPAATAPLSPAGKLRLAAEILLVYPASWRGLRSNDLRSMVAAARTGARVARSAPAASPAEATALGQRLGWAVLRTLAVLPADSRCLIRSLVLLRLLTRRGIDATLVIGVRPADRGVDAHAWVERGGVPLLPTGGGRFERLIEV